MIKSDKHLLFMQILAILPLSVFLFIYIENYIVFFIPVILIVYNSYRARQKIALIQYPLLSILILSFLVYALYDLGSRETPQTFEIFDSNNNTASFKFDTIKKIDRICYYSGIDNNSKFSLSYLDKNQLKPLYKYNKNFPFSFQWHCIDTDVNTSEITLQISDSSLMMGEIRFMYNDLTYDDLIIEVQTDNHLLVDEPEFMVDSSYFGGMFFDEIYFSRAAYEIIHDINIYETAHPNLGKFLITPGIKAFGMTPFGWRVMNVLFAALFILVFYYFSLQLFKSEHIAFAGALMITYSFMHFTQARVGLIDTFGVFFVFTSYYYLYRFIIRQKLSPLLLSGLFFGLASAVKWSAVFASIGFFCIALYLLYTKYPMKKPFNGSKFIFYGLLSYGVLATTIYLLTFFNIYIDTGSFKSIYWYQLHIYNYHSGLDATHSYSSAWWSWPLNIKPMSYYRETKDALFSAVTVFGNPAIFWMGIIALFYLVYVVVRRATLESIVILCAFLGLYLPYAFIDRLMFIYHFYYALPFMILALLFFWKDLTDYSTKFYVPFYLFLVLVVVLFLLFYPVLSGYKVPMSYVNDYLAWGVRW